MMCWQDLVFFIDRMASVTELCGLGVFLLTIHLQLVFYVVLIR